MSHILMYPLRYLKMVTSKKCATIQTLTSSSMSINDFPPVMPPSPGGGGGSSKSGILGWVGGGGTVGRFRRCRCCWRQETTTATRASKYSFVVYMIYTTLKSKYNHQCSVVQNVAVKCSIFLFMISWYTLMIVMSAMQDIQPDIKQR